MEATTTKEFVAGNEAIKPFGRVAVLGAGTMGSQIAAHFANAGLQVFLLDIAPDEGDNPNAVVDKLFSKAKKLKPDPFFADRIAERIVRGNFDDDFHFVGDVDWVVEAVVERMEVKKDVLKRIEEAAGPDTVVSSNTSGLPIAEISSDCSDSFRARFLGTHFFNPPRYLKLCEVIPTEETDPAVLRRVLHFARVHLGKGTVVAKDRPYFIGNRIGIYGMLSAIRKFTNGDYTIEEVDRLTGPIVGRPKSATFRTADVVGLDVMKHVIENLYEAVPEDENREAFTVPDVLNRLVDANRLGAKSGAGFYKKEDGEIKSVNPDDLTYGSGEKIQLGSLKEIKQAGRLDDRLKALWNDDSRAGAFFRSTTVDLLAYAARRIPEISDLPADVDRAIRWGFGWEKGPFEIWDSVGFDDVLAEIKSSGEPVADWILEMEQSGQQQFYKSEAGNPLIYFPIDREYVEDEVFHDELRLDTIKSDGGKTIWSNSEAALLDIGDDVALFEFRSKANSLGQEVIAGLNEAIDLVESSGSLRGMVIGNEGTNFSVGANLGEAAMAVAMGEFDMVESYVKKFQQTIQRVRYAEKPVVVCTHQRVLGGACEMTMACPQPVAAAESYIGLVELGVGLIPAGTGTMRLAALASEKSANGFESEIQGFLTRYFEQVAMAKVATSAAQARDMDYLSQNAQIVMNDARRFYVARERVKYLSESGYLPPSVNASIRVLGRDGAAALIVGASQYRWGNYISEYDLLLASKLARVLTGGDLTGPADVHEDYLLELERETFLSLLGEEKTMERIQHILTTNKPLRN